MQLILQCFSQATGLFSFRGNNACMTVIKPKRLALGQTIGVVAPSSPPRQSEDIDLWLEQIRKLGFRVKAGKHLYDRYGYLAGRDEDRAADINAAFADDAIDAIVCLRSGMGSARTLPFLDFELIRNHPKIVIGFSDLTALINAIHAKTGLVTFHGPEAEDQIISRPYSRFEFERVLMAGASNIVMGDPLAMHALAPDSPRKPAVGYVSGKARGRLVGGNLNTIVALLGTPFEPDFEGKLLFLETYNQDTYFVGSMMQHLWLAGKLQQVAGVVFGQFDGCEEIGFTLQEVLAERFVQMKKPAIYGLAIGHMDEQATTPIGCKCELDVDAGSLTLLEPAVA